MVRVYVELTKFGKTRLVKAQLVIRHRQRMGQVAEIDEVLFADRIEDEYAAMSMELRDKNIAIVKPADWANGIPV